MLSYVFFELKIYLHLMAKCGGLACKAGVLFQLFDMGKELFDVLCSDKREQFT